MHAKLLQSCPTVCDPPACIAHQAPLSMGLSRQDYWRINGHFLLQGIFPMQGLNQISCHLLHWQAGCLSLGPPESLLRSQPSISQEVSSHRNLTMLTS